MSFVVAVVVVLSLLGCASSGELLDINLSGAPNSCGSQVVESINLFVDSEGDWELAVSAEELRAQAEGREVVLPPDRLSVRVNDGPWVKLQKTGQLLLSGSGPSGVKLEYRFDPLWEDSCHGEVYDTRLTYDLSSGRLFASFCSPGSAAPGDSVKIVFAREKLEKAEVQVEKDGEVVFQQAVTNAKQVQIPTKHPNGTFWGSGRYDYQVSSFGAMITKGSFSVCDLPERGAIRSATVKSEEEILFVEGSIVPTAVQEGSRAVLSLDICNLSAEPLEDILVEITLPEGAVWFANSERRWTKAYKELAGLEKTHISLDFAVFPSAKKTEYACEVKVSVTQDDGRHIVAAKSLAFQVKRGLLSEPGIVVGEVPDAVYFADGTKVVPQDGYFSLQLEPGSYGVLLGDRPYVLNVSRYSERTTLAVGDRKKLGLIELKADISKSPAFGVKGFCQTDHLQLAFVYPYKNFQNYHHTSYPSWGTKQRILERTPWQMNFSRGDFHFTAGTVYSSSPLEGPFSSAALVGAEVGLAPGNGLQLQAVGGFHLEKLVEEEFLADGTTGPYLLKSAPTQGTVKVIVESRNSRNQVVKTSTWDFYVDGKSVRLKKPLAESDQLGLKNYLVVSYVSETEKRSDKFFGGGHVGFRQGESGLFLYRHLQDEGIMGTLSYKGLTIGGNLGSNAQEVSLAVTGSTARHQLQLASTDGIGLAYKFDYHHNFDAGILISGKTGEAISKGELAFDFENSLFKATLRQKLIKEKEQTRDFSGEYAFYSGSLKWPKNLTWSISLEKFNGRKSESFSTRMMYKLLGFSGYVEGTWRFADGRPSVFVNLSHDKVPLTVNAEWEHISPEFSLLEVCYDTKALWTKLSLCAEKAGLKRTLGVTVVPKEGLLYLGLSGDDLKTEYHVPLSRTGFKLSVSGNLDTKILVMASELDVALSQRSHIGVSGAWESGLNNSFRLEGFYRFKTDNLQLETRLSERETGVYLTYLIPLGRSS